MRNLEIGEHLVIDPRVCHGKMTFKGTRLPVETVLSLLTKKRRSLAYVLKSWPHLKRAAVEEAVQLAAAAWPELLEEEAGQGLKKLAATLKNGKRGGTTYEPVHSG